MLSPLALPCLSNDEVVFTMTFQCDFLQFNYEPKSMANKINLVEAQ